MCVPACPRSGGRHFGTHLDFHVMEPRPPPGAPNYARGDVSVSLGCGVRAQGEGAKELQRGILGVVAGELGYKDAGFVAGLRFVVLRGERVGGWVLSSQRVCLCGRARALVVCGLIVCK